MRAALGESKDLLSPGTLALKSSARESGPFFFILVRALRKNCLTGDGGTERLYPTPLAGN